MKQFVGFAIMSFLVSLAIAMMPSGVTGGNGSPPNWKASATGDTRPEGGVNVDDFAGKSSHLGRFTAAGYHVLNPADFTFVGQAGWTASNGDTLYVTYTGQAFFSGDPDFPFGFDAILVANGGTGRFADAKGNAVMTGAFTGVPGDFYLEVHGTLDVQRK